MFKGHLRAALWIILAAGLCPEQQLLARTANSSGQLCTNVVASGEPEIFAPTVISGPASDAAISFSRSGRELFFERGAPGLSVILTSRRTSTGWTKPTGTPFSGRWLDLEPAVAPDDSYLIFVSNRPDAREQLPVDGYYYGKRQIGKGGRLWRVDRTATGWGQPRLLPKSVNVSDSIYEPSIAANGDLYFQMADPDGRRFQLYVAAVAPTGYLPPRPLELGGGPGASDMDPAIAFNGTFILFASDRVENQNRLFISFREPGGWSPPTPLGDDVNGAGSVGDPRLGPDPTRLYFTSRRTVPLSGDLGCNLHRAEAYNNGLPNIWSTRFNPLVFRVRQAPSEAPRPRM